MLVCGAAMHMNYCQYSSGSNIDRNVLTQTFGYDKSCHCLSRNFFTPREWSRALAAELQAGRPILYSATSDYEGGHEFICDGIDEEGRFHFNWGWGGLHNGYYDITPLDPSTMQTYIGNQIATIGIQPDLGGENLHISNDISYSELNVSVELNHLTHQSYLMASLAGLSALETTANAKMGYILYDCNGNIIKKGINNNISLEPGLYYSNYPLANITFGKNFEDGTYYLVPAYGESSEDLQPITGGSSKTYKDYIVVTIKNRNISASLSKTQSKDDIRLAISKNLTTKEDGTNILYAGVSNNISFDITNNGENYDGTLEIIHRTKQTTEGPEGSKEIEIEDTKARTLINIEKGETQTITQAINADEGEITLEVWTYQTNNGEKKKIGELTYTGKPTSEGAYNLSIENVEILTPRITLNQDLKFKITINNTGGFFQGRLQCGIQTRLENSIYSSSPSTNEVISIDKEQKTFILSLPVYHLFDGLDITTGKGTLLNRYEFTVVDDATGISNSTITAASHKAMIYSINGTPCGYDLETLPKGIYIQSGKKIIK